MTFRLNQKPDKTLKCPGFQTYYINMQHHENSYLYSINILHITMDPNQDMSKFTWINSNTCWIKPTGVNLASPKLLRDSSPRAFKLLATSVSSGLNFPKSTTSLMILLSLEISDAALLRISSTPVCKWEKNHQ